MQADERNHLLYPLVVTIFGVLLTILITRLVSSDPKPTGPNEEIKRESLPPVVVATPPSQPPPPSPPQTKASVPTKYDALHCPVCGAKLVLRHNRTTGEPFFGCSRYPSCKGTRRYDEELAKQIPKAKARKLLRVPPSSASEELKPPKEQ